MREVALSRALQVAGLVAAVAWLLLAAAPLPSGAATGDPPPLPGVCSESDRFGFWTVRHPVDHYGVGTLHAGWYTKGKVDEDPPHPAGMRFPQLVRIAQGEPPQGVDAACYDPVDTWKCPTWDELSAVAQKNPGSLWLIGNEPDRQDYVYADRYAELYHEFYTFLKAEDPTCLVAVGGVVQATPIRLQYLDLILDAYLAQYGEPLPVDVWNVHNYVLREGETGWGCGIPPGTDPALAIEYKIDDHDSVDYFIGHLTSMRQWMRDRGYRDRPLIVSEFGILMPGIYGYDYERVRDFMMATFDWLTTATDANSGYPADANRLVQAWAWYSLDDAAFEGWDSWSHLFDPDTKVITDLGLDFGTYTSALTAPYPGTVDLQPVSVRLAHPEPGQGTLITVTAVAEIYNGGAQSAEDVLVRFQRGGEEAGEAVIPSIGAGEKAAASTEWPNLTVGQLLQVTVHADPDGDIVECDPYNNVLTVLLRVTSHRTYLPLVHRHD